MSALTVPRETVAPPAPVVESDPCSIEGCARPARSKSLCNRHYRRALRTGDPLTPTRKFSNRGEPRRFLLSIPMDGEGCLSWPFGRDARGNAKIYANGRMQNAARIVCERTFGKPPSRSHEAAHDCGKAHEGCIAPWHLRWATPSENQADRIIHGTHVRGEMNPMAKLTDAQVEEIQTLIGRYRQREIAEKYGVCRQTISSIFLRKRRTSK